MHIHILGIAGTFMASLAILAKEKGYYVTGQDQNIYPPMSTQLLASGIDFIEEYNVKDLPIKADLIIIGNVMRRGLPIIEYILDHNLKYMSGPQFIAKFILKDQHVLAVTGTHGKTTTTSMLAWILEYAGLQPGFLIGGIPKNFELSARNSPNKFFVIEGDEYDCAFFDKRSKFIHYQPKTLIVNNIEFDHADIFSNIDAIILQFHYLLRLIPGNGLIVFNQKDDNIKKLLQMGCWSKTQPFSLELFKKEFNLLFNNLTSKSLLPIIGDHNISNAFAACLAAQHVGVKLEIAMEAITKFTGVKRRLEYKGCHNGINIYDDFAHHPTAINTTIMALLKHLNANVNIVAKHKAPIIAVIDLGSNTMKMGVNNKSLIAAVQKADQVYFFANLNKIAWNVQEFFESIKKPGKVCFDIKDLTNTLISKLQPGDNVLFMSNVNLATASDQLVTALT